MISKFIGTCVVVLSLLTATNSYAHVEAVPTANPQSRDQIVQQREQDSIENAIQWTDVGRAIGVTIGETATALSVSTNEFIKTPVGYLTLFAIAVYLIGGTLWNLLIAVPALIVGWWWWWTLFNRFFGTTATYIETKTANGDIRKQFDKHVTNYPFVSEDIRLGVGVLFIIAAAIQIIALLVVLF